MSSTSAGFILIACGVLVMIGTTFKWWIVTREGKLLNRIIGDNTARVIYFGIGVFTFIKGIELATGAHWLPF